MTIEILKSKIHRATVTKAELHYVGSITIDQDLMDASGLLPFEKVDVLNINNGARIQTYTITGKRGSGEICLNGAAARLVEVGDLIIVVSYCSLPITKAKDHQPKVIFPDADNRI